MIKELNEKGLITEVQNIKDLVPALLRNLSNPIYIESRNTGDAHGLDDLKVEQGNQQFIRSPVQKRGSIPQLVNDFMMMFEKLPKVIKMEVIKRLIQALDVVAWFMTEIFPWITKGWEYVTEKVQAFLQDCQKLLIDLIDGAIEKVQFAKKEILESIDDFKRGMGQFFQSAKEAINRVISSTLDKIEKGRELWKSFKDKPSNSLKKFSDNIKSDIEKNKEAIVSGVKHLYTKLMNWNEKLKDGAKQLFQSFIEGVNTAKHRLEERLRQLVHFTKDQIQRALEQWKQWKQWKETASTKVNEMIKDITSYVKNKKDAFVSKLSKFKSNVSSLNGDLKNSAIKNIKAIVKATVSSVRGMNIKARLDQLQGLHKSLQRKDEHIANIVRQILSMATRVTSDVGRNYPEAYVQSQLREIERICDQIERESRQVNDTLQSKSEGIKYSIDKYRDTEASLSRLSFT